MIIDVDAEERRIGLSIKAVAKAEAGIDYRAYLAETAKPAAKGATSKGSMGTLNAHRFPVGKPSEQRRRISL